MLKNGYFSVLAISAAFFVAPAAVYADDPATQSKQFRQEVLGHLKERQTSLDQLLEDQKLTLEQFRAQSGKLNQLALQLRIDDQAQGRMTQSDRDVQFELIRQIDLQTSEFVTINTAKKAAPPAVTGSSSPVAGSTGTQTQ